MCAMAWGEGSKDNVEVSSFPPPCEIWGQFWGLKPGHLAWRQVPFPNGSSCQPSVLNPISISCIEFLISFRCLFLISLNPFKSLKASYTFFKHILKLFLCVCECTVCVHMCTSVHAIVGHGITAIIFYYPLSTIFLRHGFLLRPEHINLLGWPMGSWDLHVSNPSTRVTEVHCHAWLFTQVDELWSLEMCVRTLMSEPSFSSESNATLAINCLAVCLT